jgi:virulence-associated protein VagC
MATDLVGNVKLQRFIELLSELNHQCVEAIKTGNTAILEPMQKTVEEMYSIQSVGTEDAYTAIEEDAQIIYKNFNAAVTMLKSFEGNKIDKTTSEAVRIFVRNIFDANVRIVLAYGLA